MYYKILINLVTIMSFWFILSLLERLKTILYIYPVLQQLYSDSHPIYLFQVLPDDMIVLAEPDPSDMVQAIKKAIYILPKIDPQVMHDRVSYFD